MLGSERGVLDWIKWIFVSGGRLRSGWRVTSYIVASRATVIILLAVSVFAFAIFYLAQGVSPALLAPCLSETLTEFFRGPSGLAAGEVIQLAVTLLAVFVWRRAFDKKSFRSLGLELHNRALREFLIGVGIVTLEWAVIFGFSLTTAIVKISGTYFDFDHLVGGIGLLALFNLLVGLNEELDARGYILQNLAEGVRFFPAVLISSLYFGALHLLNPGANLASTLGVAFFGVTAALAFWVTGRLWMGIGMHAAWNVLEGPVFGFLVSGIDMGGLLRLDIQGPEWLTGGAFGPEAGALTIVPEVILIAVLFAWGWKRKHAQAT